MMICVTESMKTYPIQSAEMIGDVTGLLHIEQTTVEQ